MKGESLEEQRPELEVVWSRQALCRLREIHRYVAADKPRAADRLSSRIVSVITTLRKYPYIGRAGAEPGVRELVIGGTPYIVSYKAGRKRVRILTIWHGAQERSISR